MKNVFSMYSGKGHTLNANIFFNRIVVRVLLMWLSLYRRQTKNKTFTQFTVDVCVRTHIILMYSAVAAEGRGGREAVTYIANN